MQQTLAQSLNITPVLRPISFLDQFNKYTAIRDGILQDSEDNAPMSLADALMGKKKKKRNLYGIDTEQQQYQQPQAQYINGNLQPTSFMDNYNYYKQQQNPYASLADYFQGLQR
jgi:hypothetical protein